MRPRTLLVGLLLLSLALLTPAVVLGVEGTSVKAAILQSEQSENATVERIEAWQTSADGTTFEDAADVRSAIEGGTLSRATAINGSHLLVVEMALPGFEESVADASGSTTERFRTALAEHGDLEIRQTDMGPNQLPLYVDALNGTGVTVYPDYANGTYYASIDLDEALLVRSGSPSSFQRSGTHKFDVRARLDGDSPLTEEMSVAMAAVAPREASVQTAPDGRVQLRPLPDQTVSGTANVGVGSSVTVVVTGESNPETDANESFRLVREATIRVTEDRFRYEGRFDATLDVTDLSPAATNVTVDVRIDGRSLLDTPVSARVNSYRASVATADVVRGGGSAGVTVTASLSAGGFLTLHERSPDGRIVGHSQYLEPGDNRVTVYLNEPTGPDSVVVVAHRDVNHNEWFDGADTDTPYAGQGATDTAAFDLQVPSPVTPTPTDTPPGPTPTVTPTESGTTPATGTTPDDETPGVSGSDGDPTATGSSGDPDIGGAVLPVIGLLIAGVLLVAVVRAR